MLIGSTCKINKYKIPLFDIVKVTSTKLTYSIGFTFLAYGKEDNITYDLQMCLDLLKYEDNIRKVIAIDRDTPLINVVVNVSLNLLL